MNRLSLHALAEMKTPAEREFASRATIEDLFNAYRIPFDVSEMEENVYLYKNAKGQETEIAFIYEYNTWAINPGTYNEIVVDYKIDVIDELANSKDEIVRAEVFANRDLEAVENFFEKHGVEFENKEVSNITAANIPFEDAYVVEHGDGELIVAYDDYRRDWIGVVYEYKNDVFTEQDITDSISAPTVEKLEEFLAKNLNIKLEKEFVR